MATKTAAAKKPPTKSEIYNAVAEGAGLTRKEAVAACDALTAVMTKSLKKNGVFNLLGLAKLTVVKKPAVKGGKMVRNPFTGDMVKQKPKPASKKVRVRAMKKLNDSV